MADDDEIDELGAQIGEPIVIEDVGLGHDYDMVRARHEAMHAAIVYHLNGRVMQIRIFEHGGECSHDIDDKLSHAQIFLAGVFNGNGAGKDRDTADEIIAELMPIVSMEARVAYRDNLLSEVSGILSEPETERRVMALATALRAAKTLDEEQARAAYFG